mgnify:CR=1 FL=1
MSAIRKQPTKISASSSKKDLLTVCGIILVAATLLFAYLMWYVAPEEYTEKVKIIAVTDEGCIAETFDGYAVNVGDCQVSAGDYFNASIDKKVKERASLMNPTT